MKRSISNQFLENLKNGALHVIVDHVRVDPYLDLELRGNCVMVYYRGGKILTVYENQNLEGLAEEYYKKESETAKIVPSFECIHEYLHMPNISLTFTSHLAIASLARKKFSNVWFMKTTSR